MSERTAQTVIDMDSTAESAICSIKRLYETEARLQFIVEAASLGEWKLDLDSGLLNCSLRDDSLFVYPGYPDSQTLATFLERVHPEDRKLVQTAISEAAKSFREFRFECRIQLSAQRMRWVCVKGSGRDDGAQGRCLQGIVIDITEQKRTEAIAQGQQRALELAVSGAPLHSILNILTQSAEEQSGGNVNVVVLLIDESGKHLRMGSSLSLPEAYNQSIDGLAIGPLAGSCGSAAFFRRPVIVSDVETDPRWVDFRHLALSYNLRACWALPILSTQGRVLGTMAFYCNEAREPTASELAAMALLVNTAALVIERDWETKERALAEQALQASEKRFRSLVQATNAIVWTASPTLEIVSPQPDWAAFTGQTYEEMQGFGWMETIHPEDQAETSSLGMSMLQSPRPVYAEYRLRRGDGQYRYLSGYVVPIYDAKGVLKEWAGSYTDVTERKESEKRLHHLATHDTLTGLPNRIYLNEHLQELIDFTPDHESIAVMLIDFDRFKYINDSMGHESGDAMLRQVAHRLKAALPSGDLVARLGGDEFVVLAHVSSGLKSAEAIADELMKAIALPVDIAGHPFFPGASIGICLYPQQGKTKEELIQHADIAMYRAKAAGGQCYRFFSAEMSIETKQRMALEMALRGAIEKEEFALHYQPRLRLPDMQVQGVEALIRWHHPQRGVISPLELIPVAEETGIINELGIWVLHKACMDISALNACLGCSLRVSVNLSPRQLKSPHLIKQVRQALEHSRLDPALLELELTESAFIEDMDLSTHVMRELKALGVYLAVDDFGTGYSGLSYLRRFPIDVVKLDRTFVTQPAEGMDRYAFIKAITDMAHALNLYVVAEGVEDTDTLDLLKKATCDEAQGYLFAKPLPYDELLRYPFRE
ncbi:PAS domain S-box-containing protein/diguanylate cyclase (GGDEF)-like protein [Pseudomonas duriflava]|uniref:PAS domain S-box-containing protein/diguanylate cyclase (GGDEF)-like protein n=1 Tax=Pseudomonas duriflava TaxID=459528 RepID=A0A562Q745_9PSED|nr:EAL domain-containing protein [Pseudomonas duriflava]TWI52553.1 PAS domain S-box-containing protein/diguanylate cyclase (GGDEF)-like protein [Pseudomonas duriflava]